MKKYLSMVMATMLIVSSVIVFTGCGGTEPAKQTKAEDQVTETPAVTEQAEQSEAKEPAEQPEAEEPAADDSAATVPGVEVMGISKYSRTELGMMMELKTA